MPDNDINKRLHKANSSLAIIYGYLQLLEKEATSQNHEKELKWIQKAIEACKNLEGYIVES